MEELERPRAAERKQKHGGTAPGRKANTSGESPEVKGDTREKVSEVLARCYRCDEEKALSEFARDRSKASGRKSICKVCDREKAANYYEQNGERVRARVNARNGALRGEAPAQPSRHRVGGWPDFSATPA